MKDLADQATGELTLDQLADFVKRAKAAQRALDKAGFGRLPVPPDPRPRPKRGVSKNAAKSAAKPERGER